VKQEQQVKKKAEKDARKKEKARVAQLQS